MGEDAPFLTFHPAPRIDRLKPVSGYSIERGAPQLAASACRPISPLPATSHRELSDSHGFLRVATPRRSASVLGWTCWPRRPSMGFALENQVRTGLTAGGKEIRTAGPSHERVGLLGRR